MDTNSPPATDKMMSDQVYIFISYVFEYWTSGLVVKELVMTRQTWVRRLPGKVRFLNFQIFEISMAYDIFKCSGYVETHLDKNDHNHHGLVGVGVGLMTVRLLVRFSGGQNSGT